MSLDATLAELVARAVEARTAELKRPELVTQRTVLAVLSMPPRDYLAHCRAGDWPSWADRRLRYARTEDVLAWIRAQSAARAVPANDSEATAFAKSRSGLRRIA